MPEAPLHPAAAGKDRTDSNLAARGFAFAFCAYFIWGLTPIYMKAMDHMPAVEIVLYRALCSVPIAGIILILLGRTSDLILAFRQPRILLLLSATAMFISINWGVYTWAVSVGRTVETALGYYINPLVNVLFGALLLGERFNKWQLVAIVLAVTAVILLTIHAGSLPWVSLVLAFSFGFYGYIRKIIPIGAAQGFFLEVLILSIPCLTVLMIWFPPGQGHFLAGNATDTWLLLAAGPATAIPLILFATGAKLLRYSTIGLMQYLAPTLIFIIAVFLFKEPFSIVQFVAFCLIWSALAIYSWSSLTQSRASEETTSRPD